MSFKYLFPSQINAQQCSFALEDDMDDTPYRVDGDVIEALAEPTDKALEHFTDWGGIEHD